MKKLTLQKVIIFITSFLIVGMITSGSMAQEVDKSVSKIIQDWPKASKKVAQKAVKKFGAPDGRTPSRLIWFEQGGWNEIILRRDPINHDFPMPHKDVLYQEIKYEVPADKYDELAHFDGSLVIERTKGTLGVRCDKEKANYIAINLAHDIIEGKRSVEEARQKYGELIKMMVKGESSEYINGFIFDVPRGETADPDKATLDPQTIKKLKKMMKQKSKSRM